MWTTAILVWSFGLNEKVFESGIGSCCYAGEFFCLILGAMLVDGDCRTTFFETFESQDIPWEDAVNVLGAITRRRQDQIRGCLIQLFGLPLVEQKGGKEFIDAAIKQMAAMRSVGLMKDSAARVKSAGDSTTSPDRYLAAIKKEVEFLSKKLREFGQDDQDHDSAASPESEPKQ